MGLARPSPLGRPAVLRQIKVLTRVVLAFAVGAGLGGMFGVRLHFWAIVLPVIAVAACGVGELRAGVPAAVTCGSPTVPPGVLG